MSNNILLILYLGNCFTNTSSPLCSSSRVELNSLDAALITRLVPLDSPIGGADNDGVSPESLALVISSSLLHTKDPFVVTIPAVKCLVSWKETVDHEESANVVLDVVQKVLLLFVETRDTVA
jgi:hypothetical protein